MSRRSEPGRGAAWAGTAMSWLGRVTQLVELTGCWLLGVLAGGIVLGWLPAGVAAGSVLHKLTGPEPSDRPVAEFFGVWRASFGRANAVGWPATIAVPVLVLDLWILSHDGPPWLPVVVVANVVFAAWLMLAVGYLMSLLMLAETRGLPMAKLWRTSLVMPLASPATTLVWLLCMLILGVVARFVPMVAMLCAPGYVILVTSWLTRRRLHNSGVAHDEEQELLADVPDS